MDFMRPIVRQSKKDLYYVCPEFISCKSKDLMVRGGDFYAVWDDANNIWSTDAFRLYEMIDSELWAYRDRIKEKYDDHGWTINVKTISEFSTNVLSSFIRYLKATPNNFKQLDSTITFTNTEIGRKDYVSRRLPYSITDRGDESNFERRSIGRVYSSEWRNKHIQAYDELMSTLYDEDERRKLEWAIGSIIAGDSKRIQKFIVLYGLPGSGKSTVLEIIQRLLEGYYTAFEAKILGQRTNAFAIESFRDNPLVAIQHEGDLSRIEDNTTLNSVISHEEMVMNVKNKSTYTMKLIAFLFMATNRPVKITDSKSGIIRRLIDVSPSGRLVPVKKYHKLIEQIGFELGSIARYCLELYSEMGANYYSNYKAFDMILKTDIFFNFMEANFEFFKETDEIGVSQVFEMYKQYCDVGLIEYKLPLYKFREELKDYFSEFADMKRIDGRQVRAVYSGFLASKFDREANTRPISQTGLKIDSTASERHSEGGNLEKGEVAGNVSSNSAESWLRLSKKKSLLDDVCMDCIAQYSTLDGRPTFKWDNVRTVLSDIDSHNLHYVRLPPNHIVIDFDLKDDTGSKSKVRNLEAASKWPATYAELSKSEEGIHLHYYYEGDVTKLAALYSDGIEVKIFTGHSSLRRKLTECNDIPITTISGGLPIKEKRMISFSAVKDEKHLRSLILKNLRKEIHPNTRPSIDFIFRILEEAYYNGLKYDITDLRPSITAFAVNSSNQSEYCIDKVGDMKFRSDEPSIDISFPEGKIVFYDVEVFPNLFVVVLKPEEGAPIQLINPTPRQIEPLLSMKLVGFNCRRYDNHILYARYIGYDNYALYKLSQRIIDGSPNAMFGEAYNISYTDILDFSSKKQSLKKFEIELGIHHKELGFKWDEEVPEEKWKEVADYCINDVVATEATFNARKADFTARLILSELSGLSPNHTTQQHTAKIIFGDDKKPQSKFNYLDLSEMFPGYKYSFGKSEYRGEDPKEGGYVYAEPGMYNNVALLDVASMHPTSAICMDIFGPYTKNYEALLKARLAIKKRDFKLAGDMLDGRLKPYLKSQDQAEDLSYALKIVINIVYGLTSASFENPFRDPRNKDNIVAKRGALFMIDLKHAVQEMGYTVAHIKTDSIKIPNATQEIIDFVFKFGDSYGYTFEHEATYEKLCLVNDSTYVCVEEGDKSPKFDKDGLYKGPWHATGTQFIHPYTFKTLFSGEPLIFDDFCETKSVTTALYLDMNEGNEDNHNYQFIGRVGSFCPIKPGFGGGVLLREKDGKYNAATGSKGYRWLEAETVKALGKEDQIDHLYFSKLVDDAIKTIGKFGDVEQFRS